MEDEEALLAAALALSQVDAQPKPEAVAENKDQEIKDLLDDDFVGELINELNIDMTDKELQEVLKGKDGEKKDEGKKD